MSGADALVSMTAVEKAYQGLRPLRIADLQVPAGAVMSIAGIDAPGAEVLVHLLTGAMLPESGTIRLFGHATDAIADYEAWLRMLDGVGLLTVRAVLLEQCTVAQNLALPLTIQIDPIPDEFWPQVRALAADAGVPDVALETPVGAAGPEVVQRVRLARALALGPRLLVAEHPSQTLPREAVAAFARDLAAIAARRGMAVLAVSADREFTRALGGTVLTLDAASGVLSRPGFLSRLGLR
jgi:ABC-type uncharacterized transport system ATPase subunit